MKRRAYLGDGKERNVRRALYIRFCTIWWHESAEEQFAGYREFVVIETDAGRSFRATRAALNLGGAFQRNVWRPR